MTSRRWRLPGRTPGSDSPDGGRHPPDDPELTASADHLAAARALRAMFTRDFIYLGASAVQVVIAALMTPIQPAHRGRRVRAVSLAIVVAQLLGVTFSLGLPFAVQKVFVEENGDRRSPRGTRHLRRSCAGRCADPRRRGTGVGAARRAGPGLERATDRIVGRRIRIHADRTRRAPVQRQAQDGAVRRRSAVGGGASGRRAPAELVGADRHELPDGSDHRAVRGRPGRLARPDAELVGPTRDPPLRPDLPFRPAHGAKQLSGYILGLGDRVVYATSSVRPPSGVTPSPTTWAILASSFSSWSIRRGCRASTRWRTETHGRGCWPAAAT